MSSSTYITITINLITIATTIYSIQFIMVLTFFKVIDMIDLKVIDFEIMNSLLIPFVHKKNCKLWYWANKQAHNHFFWIIVLFFFLPTGTYKARQVQYASCIPFQKREFSLELLTFYFFFNYSSSVTIIRSFTSIFSQAACRFITKRI